MDYVVDDNDIYIVISYYNQVRANLAVLILII